MTVPLAPSSEPEAPVAQEGAGPEVLIGIPSCRRPDGLRALLASLAAQQRVEEVKVAVFVADNDPLGREGAEACAELAGSYRWPLSSEVVPERGISAVRNAILNEARRTGAMFVAMLDDDEVADPQWLRAMIDAQGETGADIVGAPVLYDFEHAPDAAVLRSGYFSPRRWAAGPVPLLDQTGNVLLSCRALERIGWPKFDLSFGLTGGGDKEYFTRLQKQGVRFAWAPQAIASETVPASRLSQGWILRRAFRVGNADMRISRLHGSRSQVIGSGAKAVAVLLTVPLTAVAALVAARRISIMAKWSRALGKLAALGDRNYQEYAGRTGSP